MEKRLFKKIDQHNSKFKDDIKAWIEKNNCSVVCNEDSVNKLSEFLQFIYDYETINISKDDFQKRKRIKNTVPLYDRCNARRANGEQCSRRKKVNEDYCGTHLKGQPHGVISDEKKTKNVKKVEIWVQEIKGISYYIDGNGNVYNHEDILSNSNKPRVIAKWCKNSDGSYSIPEIEE